MESIKCFYSMFWIMIIEIVLTVFFVVMNGYFVASEFALVRMRASSVEKLVNEGRFGSKTLEGILANLDDYLAVTQIGITISSLALGRIGEHAISNLLIFILPSEWESIVPAAALFGAAFLVITYLHVVFGELAPKTIAIQRAEKFSCLTAKPMKFFYYLFLPGILVFNGSSNKFTKLIGIEPASETEEILSEEEIISILRDSNRRDKIDEDELDVIENVFELDDTVARDIMTPRDDVLYFEPGDSVEKMKEIVIDGTYQRYPVISENKIHGFIDVRQIISNDVGEGLTAQDILKDMPNVGYNTQLDDIIEIIKEENREIVAILDENGEFIGIITSEDLLEELLGDIKSYFEEYR